MHCFYEIGSHRCRELRGLMPSGSTTSTINHSLLTPLRSFTPRHLGEGEAPAELAFPWLSRSFALPSRATGFKKTPATKKGRIAAPFVGCSIARPNDKRLSLPSNELFARL